MMGRDGYQVCLPAIELMHASINSIQRRAILDS